MLHLHRTTRSTRQLDSVLLAELLRPVSLEKQAHQRVAVLLLVPDQLAALIDRPVGAFDCTPPRLTLQRVGRLFDGLVPLRSELLVALAQCVEAATREADLASGSAHVAALAQHAQKRRARVICESVPVVRESTRHFNPSLEGR